MTNEDFVVAKFEQALDLSFTIDEDVVIARRALAGLLTDKDRDKIYNDIDALIDALEEIKHSTSMIKRGAEDAKRELGKEDHNTTE